MAPAGAAQDTPESDPQVEINIFDGAIFYDGYAELDRNLEADADDGILRHRNSLYAVRLTDEQLNRIGTRLDLSVTVQALCDNYDRIGNVNIAFVPKHSPSYKPDEVTRIEIGRFITPFMNMNKQPDRVPYHYWADYLSPLLRDANLREKYDYWMELEIFGIPYDAQKKVRGCEGRNDVFKGYLSLLTTDDPQPLTDDHVLVPIVIKNPEYVGKNLNNYQDEATDELGTTRKTYKFKLDKDVADGQIVLITSNHGANADGEEYNRRWHFVDFDSELVLEYRPGRTSCEPFREYNTQPNGIYNGMGNLTYRSDRAWQSFSNWCPGDVIDNRIINLGPVKAGTHEIVIDVPDAVFPEKQGDFPVSIYFQGSVSGLLPRPASIDTVREEIESAFTVSTDSRIIRVSTTREVRMLEIHNTDGRCLRRQYNADPVDASSWAPGTYLVSLEETTGLVTTRKVSLR